jgi:hypothetical protein
MTVLFRPISKIIPIWSYFETEPDKGIFLDVTRVIGGHIELGFEDLPIAGSGLPGDIRGALKKMRAVFPYADPVRIIERPASPLQFLFSIGINAGKCRTIFVYVRTGLPG